MPDIFQIEKEILAPADGNVHTDLIRLDDPSFIQLVPEHAVIKISRIFDHARGEFLPVQHPGLLNVSLPGKPLPRHAVKIGDHHIAAILFHGLHQKSRGLRHDPVVAVQKLDILSLRQLQRLIARIGYARIFLMDHPDPFVPSGVRIADLSGSVRASVVHQDQLKIGIILHQYAVHAASHIFFRVINGYDNTDKPFHSARSFFLIFFNTEILSRFLPLHK